MQARARTRSGRARASCRRSPAGACRSPPADQDVALLRQALRPSNQASALFAAISALLGLLLAFNALLLTVPERRRAIADLRLIGTRRAAIVQMVCFQALCLGIAASLVGLPGGYALSRGVFHQSTGYLAEAFTLGTRTVVSARSRCCWRCVGGRARDLPGLGGAAARPAPRRARSTPSTARTACPATRSRRGARRGARARARRSCSRPRPCCSCSRPRSRCAPARCWRWRPCSRVPLAFAGVLRAARALSERYQRLTILPVALASLRATTLRSLALAATGAVALFGSVALGGAREDLLRGIDGFAHSYAADADIWVGNPGDNQATVDFRARRHAAADRPAPGGRERAAPSRAASCSSAAGACGSIARPPGAERDVLESQILERQRGARGQRGSAKAAGSPSPSRSPKNTTSASAAR